MKKHIIDFLKRGVIACGFGPIVMAIVYLCLAVSGIEDSFNLFDIAMQILLVSLMAFLAAGVTVVYQIERLPLATAILIHAGVLYIDYISVYLINGWLQRTIVPIMIFTLIFIAGYALIWLIIYIVTKRTTKGLNESLRKE